MEKKSLDYTSPLDEGVIKFHYELLPWNTELYTAYRTQLSLGLNKWRHHLWKLNLIGEYPKEKVGFGNISERFHQNKSSFIISGTQTGAKEFLTENDFCLVLKSDFKNNYLQAMGCTPPSSESLTHAALYEANPNVQAVLHIHHAQFWKKGLEDLQSLKTSPVPYGTIEMASELKQLARSYPAGLAYMSGHDDGIIAWAESLNKAAEILLKAYEEKVFQYQKN
jgi:ribulose-5-phosphate 4-epimerase/fuculose-1-phosphate aldolase